MIYSPNIQIRTGSHLGLMSNQEIPKSNSPNASINNKFILTQSVSSSEEGFEKKFDFYDNFSFVSDIIIELIRNIKEELVIYLEELLSPDRKDNNVLNYFIYCYYDFMNELYVTDTRFFNCTKDVTIIQNEKFDFLFSKILENQFTDIYMKKVNDNINLLHISRKLAKDISVSKIIEILDLVKKNNRHLFFS